MCTVSQYDCWSVGIIVTTDSAITKLSPSIFSLIGPMSVPVNALAPAYQRNPELLAWRGTGALAPVAGFEKIE